MRIERKRLADRIGALLTACAGQPETYDEQLVSR